MSYTIYFKSEDELSTYIEFNDTTKIIELGSLDAQFNSVITRYKRNGYKDILNKKGIDNITFPSFQVVLKGASMETDYETLRNLSATQTTIYLDMDEYNSTFSGKYEFNGKFSSQRFENGIIIKFGLIENVNGD